MNVKWYDCDMVAVRRFERVAQRVADPTRPGKWLKAFHWVRACDTELVFQGKKYRPDESGWFDLPPHEARELTSIAAWMTRDQAERQGVDDLDDPDLEGVPTVPARRKGRSTS